MADIVLVLNAGSSSIKFSAFNADSEAKALFNGQVEGLYTAPKFKAKASDGSEIGAHAWGQGTQLGHEGAITFLTGFVRDRLAGHSIVAVGHRVVHGGLGFEQPVRVNAEVLTALRKLSPLAPLHQPHNLAPIDIITKLQPQLLQVACFDTAFHRGQPAVAQAFALPPSITERGVQRYGFHGLSYEYVASVLGSFDERAASGRTIVAHLGNGCSMCAMVGARSVASTMGFTAVDGLPMGTRCGNLDPGVLLYLMDEMGMDARAIEDLIYKQSGLLGVSGVSSDMRALLASDEPRARLAVDLFVYRVGRELGSLAAAAGGIDALVFTAGIGEHAVAIRERACQGAAWLGVELDPAANAAGGPRISTAASKVSAWIVPTNEELMIARHTLKIAQAI
ncbi:acetate/propionate family kinase [Variovorax sp. J22R133]|uniref:acetate/propionate family kinase n=1 Tax=Variovorax brevis TaxID=3053503 RepID=UPI0025752BD0|nr:acetate/propionate family kinase [Variovorax sp. J22R133]MDM0110686.1 acetate/propionate family kinase [Variovorax sp. J22R133]